MWFSVPVHEPLKIALLALALLTFSGCGRSPTAQRRAGKTVQPANHPRSVVARMAALRMDHATAGRLLAGHRYKAVHRVRVTLDDKPDQSFVDQYALRCTGRGDCYGRQDNSLEYGVEFYRIGEHTYFRHRYQRFVRFSEEPEEADRRVERIWGAGAAVIELLGDHLKTTAAGETHVAGRSAIRYKLSRGTGAVQVHSGRRAWRGRLKAMRIEGEAALDKATGVMLALKVSYAVSAPKNGRTVTLSGSFDGGLVEVKKPQVIKPPADFAVAQSRRRESRELRLLGSHRLNPGWFRGGGPQAARRGGSMRPGRGAMRSAAMRPRPGHMARPVMARPGMARPVMARPGMARRVGPGKP